MNGGQSRAEFHHEEHEGHEGRQGEVDQIGVRRTPPTLGFGGLCASAITIFFLCLLCLLWPIPLCVSTRGVWMGAERISSERNR